MATKDNLTVVLHGIEDLRLVLLQMEVVGICGSDVHYFVKGRIGPFVVKKPMIIGHEASGTVVKVGKNVKHLKPGDQVAIEPGVPCRTCSFCKSGSYNLCPDIFFCATPPDDGNLSRYYVHAADFCHKLPSNMDLEDGALMEPLSVGVHAAKRGNVQVGDVVLILGAGPIGLVTLLAVKTMGASKTLIIDIVDDRLVIAKQLGATYTLKVTKNQSEQDIIERIKRLLNDEPNKTFDCSGVELNVRIALQVTRSNGVVVLVGMGNIEQTLPLGGAVFREIDVRGVFRYCNDYPTSIDMVATGKISVKPLITHHFRLEDSLEAFDVARTQKGNPIKILIHANPNWKPAKK